MMNMAPNNRAPVNFLDLPTELKTSVLSHLPAREVQITRSVCKELQDVIDEPSNQGLMLTSARARAEARLMDELSPMFLSPCTVSLRDMVFAFLARRGIWKHPVKTAFVTDFACTQWMQIKFADAGTSVSADEGEKILHTLHYIANRFASAYKKAYHPQVTRAPGTIHISSFSEYVRMSALILGDVKNVTEFFSIIDNLPFGYTLEDLTRLGLPLDRAELGASLSEVLEKRLDGPLCAIPYGPCPQLATPQYVLTDLALFVTSGTGDATADAMPAVASGICTATQIAEILSTQSVEELGDAFGYCLKTKWAYELFQSALQGQVLSEWQKVAILEELYLF